VCSTSSRKCRGGRGGHARRSPPQTRASSSEIVDLSSAGGNQVIVALGPYKTLAGARGAVVRRPPWLFERICPQGPEARAGRLTRGRLHVFSGQRRTGSSSQGRSSPPISRPPSSNSTAGLLPRRMTQAATASERAARKVAEEGRPEGAAGVLAAVRNLIEAGVSIVSALLILEEQSDDKVLIPAIVNIRERVESGMLLSAPSPSTPGSSVACTSRCSKRVKRRERSTRSSTVWRSRSKGNPDQEEGEGAMVYPTVVLCFASLVLAGMLLFLIPVFSGIFAQLHGHLPMLTQEW